MIKIAAVTENAETLSSHFGRAPLYVVYSIADGEISAVEKRKKPHHGGSAGHKPGQDLLHIHDHEREHGQGHAHQHGEMFAPIDDCQVLLVGGMGQPAYQKAQAAGLEVYLTGGPIESAVQGYLNGELASDMRRVHKHR